MKKFNIYLSLFVIISFLLLFSDFSLSKDKISNEELNKKIETLKKILNKKFFIVQYSETLLKKEIKKYYSPDIKTLVSFKIQLFYSFGKIYGYAVFLNNDYDFSVIDNANLKITLHHEKFISDKKTFYFKINKDNFKKLTLSRGDKIIAFPIERIEYGRNLPEGTKIPVEAECFHLKASSELFLY